MLFECAASAPPLEVNKATFALLVYARASVRAPDIKVLEDFKSSSVENSLRFLSDSWMEFSNSLMAASLLAPDAGRGASRISTSGVAGIGGDGYNHCARRGCDAITATSLEGSNDR